MEIIRSDEAIETANAKSCTAYEYPLGDADVNVARIWIDGRYPMQGVGVNKEAKELVYVEEGEGIASIDGAETRIRAGDVILIQKGETMRWEGKMTLIIFCTPAWRPEQYETLKEED